MAQKAPYDKRIKAYIKKHGQNKNPRSVWTCPIEELHAFCLEHMHKTELWTSQYIRTIAFSWTLERKRFDDYEPFIVPMIEKATGTYFDNKSRPAEQTTSNSSDDVAASMATK